MEFPVLKVPEDCSTFLLRSVEIDSMNEAQSRKDDRRDGLRFSVNIPLTIFTGERAIPGYACHVSDKAVYFYLDPAESERIDRDFEMELRLPPEVTFTIWCSIRCHARLIRKDTTSTDSTGIAAEILSYSIVREAGPSA
jgi:hypothetical protein